MSSPLLLWLLLLLLGRYACGLLGSRFRAPAVAVVVVPPVVPAGSPVGGWLPYLWLGGDPPLVLREGLQVSGSGYQEFPVASVSGFLVPMSSARDLVFVHVHDLVWCRVPCSLRGARGGSPDVGPVSFLHGHLSCVVFSVVPVLHRLFGHPIILPGFSVMASSGG